MKQLSGMKINDRNRLATAVCTVLAACGMMLAPLCMAQTTVATYPFQKIQMPTTAELKLAWKTTPSEYGPQPYMGLDGPVTIESLSRDLDTMKSLGFRAVTVQAGGGMTTTYLTPEYFAFFKKFAEEAKKRDMKIWIVDEIGYPSGFAGGMFTKSKTELRMQGLDISQRIPVKAGATLNQAVAANAVAAVGVSATGERVPVSIAGGNIAWTAPTGSDYTVEVIGHEFRTAPTRSDANPTRAKDTSNSIEDYMNPDATAAYIQVTHQGYYDAMPELFGNTILGFRGDEPDYSIGGLPWTDKFFDTFQQVKGYDIRPYLGALLMPTGGGGRGRGGAAAAAGGQPTAATAPAARPAPAPVNLSSADVRARGDYYDVFSQMFRDGFFKPLGLWAAAHGVEYQVHLNHEEAEMQLVRSEGDFERDMKYMEQPGIDTIWHQIWTDTISDFPRLASSAAHVYGHPRSFTESFAAYRPEPDLTMARYILNEQEVRGINVIETMHYSASAPAGVVLPEPIAAPPATPGGPAPAVRPRGPSMLMRDPGWPALMQYLQRLSYVMSMGRPAASVALYIPSSSMWLNDSASDTAFVSSERMLSERQIDFDIINQDALATDLTAGPGYLESMSGNRYRTVIVPSALILTQTELDRLKALAKGGGKVFFLGRTPSLISGKTIRDSRAATADDFAFATVETSAQLPPTPTPPSAAPATPPGPQVVPAAIEAALNTAIGPRDISLDSTDTALKVNTRRLKDADVFLFFNEGAQTSSHTVMIKTSGKTVEAWDPETGSVSRVASTWSKGAVTVKLKVKPYETELLTVR